MALTARLCATSFAGRPAQLRPRPAGLLRRVVSSCAAQMDCHLSCCTPAERGATPSSRFSTLLTVRQPRTELKRREIRVQAGGGGDDRSPLTPPWERFAEDVELAVVRQRVQQYGLRTVEEKIVTQLRKLLEEESNSLKLFARAEKAGNDDGMQLHHADWKTTREKIDVLLANPRMFAWKYGDLYDVETEGGKRVRQAVQLVWGVNTILFGPLLVVAACTAPLFLLLAVLEALTSL